MDKHQENSSVFPISPSSSAAPTPGSTQLPTSFKKDLLNLNVSSAEIERLISQYNRQAIPIMEDEIFCKQLCQVAAAGGHVDESELDGWIRKKSSCIDRECVSARINIALAGLDFFHTDEQRHNLIAGLQGPTIHGYGRLMDCVSFLVEQTARPKNNTKHRKRPHVGYEPNHDQLQRPPRPALTMVNGFRRSTRISRQCQRRSARIKKQRQTTTMYFKLE